MDIIVAVCLVIAMAMVAYWALQRARMMDVNMSYRGNLDAPIPQVTRTRIIYFPLNDPPTSVRSAQARMPPPTSPQDIYRRAGARR